MGEWYVYATAYMWGPESNFQEPILSFYRLDLGD